MQLYGDIAEDLNGHFCMADADVPKACQTQYVGGK
jgi:hypothetical protein